MPMKTGYAFVLLAAFLIQGCGTIVHGTMQDLTIATTPPGATATIDNRSCDTPCTMNVRRTATHVTVQKGTYKEEFALDRHFDLWSSFFGNFIFGLLPGVIVDERMGGAYELLPVDITLVEPDATATTPGAPEKACAPCDERVVERVSDKAPAYENSEALSLGVSYNLMHCAAEVIQDIAYERIFGRVVSGYARFGYMDHRSNYGEYKDAASGRGVEIGMRIYTGQRGLEGWYLGGGLGFWTLRGTWQDDVGTPFVTTGEGESSVVDLTLQAGYKFYPRQYPVFIDPSLSLGLLFPSGMPDPFGPGGGYVRAGLSVGLRW